MINFFRETRKKLADDNNFFKYARYAIGEILLVVVGILIALQINNWNEANKNIELERNLLMGIKADLIADTLQMENRFKRSFRDFKRNIDLFDSLLSQEPQVIKIQYVDSIFSRCTRQRNTFWPVTGTYQSIVNNGSSEIIRNRSLFKKIQNIYDKSYVIAIDIGSRTDDLNQKIKYNYRHMNTLEATKRLANYKKASARSDIAYWDKQLSGFGQLMKAARIEAISIINEIEGELTNH